MKVLLSSVACLPDSGSEGAYGWRACLAIAKDHEVWILTSADNAERLEKARSEGRIPKSMRIHYLGAARPYCPNRLIARLEGWQRYRKFSQECLEVGRQLHQSEKFDLVQLVTYTTWRVGCPLWRLGIPLVFGPLSGTEKFPWTFWSILSPAAIAFEVLREFSGWLSWWNPSVRGCVRAASVIPVTHSQAGRVLARLRKSAAGIVPFVNVFFTREDIARLKRPENQLCPSKDEPLRIFGSGNCEGRKGVAIALEALKLLRQRGVPFYYIYSSLGPEATYLQKKVSRLGLSGQVSIGNHLSRSEYLKTLQSNEIYLLPSLREGAGQTMMEAMLAGSVPIVADLYGPSEIVTEDCGWKIPATNHTAMARLIAERLEWCFFNRHQLPSMGKKSASRIASNFSEDIFRARTKECYELALSKIH